MTRWIGLAALIVGVVLLGIVIDHADLPTTWSYLVTLGWWGFGAIVVITAVSVVLEAGSWLLTFSGLPPTAAWWNRITRVLLVGTVVEMLTPLAALGGDSAKAILLKRRHGVRLQDATASLILSRTTDVVSLVVFIGVGLILLIQADHLPSAFQLGAAAALGVLALLALVFIAAQWQRPLTRIRRWLVRRGFLRTEGRPRITMLIEAIREIEGRLVAFYASHPFRVVLSALLSFAEWGSGAVMTYLVLGFFGTPVTMADAIVIESIMLLVRSALFFVPANLGTQDGAIVFMCAAMIGSPSAGLALAAVRRVRDLLVIAAGLGLAVSSWTEARDMLTAWEDSRASIERK